MESKCLVCNNSGCKDLCEKNMCYSCHEVPSNKKDFHSSKNCPCHYSQLQVKNGWASTWSLLPNTHLKSKEKFSDLKDRLKRVLLYRRGTKDEKKEYLEKLCSDKKSWFEAMHKALDLVQTM